MSTPPQEHGPVPAQDAADMSTHLRNASDNVQYEPLPNIPDHRLDVDAPYDPPNSLSYNNTPQHDPVDLPADDLPQGAARPRFMGTALHDEGAGARDSYASSQQSYPSFGDNNSSVYALNRPDMRATPSSRFDTYRDDPNEYGSENDVPMAAINRSGPGYMDEKRAAYASQGARSKRKWIIGGSILGGIILILVIVIPVVYSVNKKNSNNSAAGGSDASNPESSAGSGSGSSSLAVTGGDGSKVTTDDRDTFTYNNAFGGYWYWDENDPFNNGAKAQSWTPALNETFNYGQDRIRGVNLGGWLVPEPFIVPALFEPYVNTSIPAIDEWTLSEHMANDTDGGGLSTLMENHYKSFITEEDFAKIAGAGLNFVRIPLAYWAIETREGEPFLAKVSWTYFLKAIKWARKYGLRINLDLHALPGSQNGWNHSGKLGSINVLNGPMGYANAQRSLDYIRIIAEFISQPEYAPVVPIFGITNEPQLSTMGQGTLSAYYLQAYDMVRLASGIGEGKGPYVSYHDGFVGLPQWKGFLPGADRIAFDKHPYLCFQGQSDAAMNTYATAPCTAWASEMNDSMTNTGLSAAGEFSLAVTDCGLWVNGVNQGSRYEGDYYEGGYSRVGSCDTWTDWQNFDDDTKNALKVFALASMDALQNWFFWTWKIGNSSVTGKVEAPQWSYSLGLENGWIPEDPRTSEGQCNNTDPWSGTLQASMTGGSGAGSIPASVSSSLAWPPASISNGGAISDLPSYTPTGTVVTLPAPTFTESGSSTASAGDGWENASDTNGLMVPISTCNYLDPWVGSTSPPSPLCSSGARRREPVPEPIITSAPLA